MGSAGTSERCRGSGTMASLKLVMCGQKAFGAAVVRRAIADGHSIVAASCPLENSRRDGPDQMREACEVHGVAVLASLTSDTIPSGVDLIVAAHSHDFVGTRTRMMARLGAIGYHPSLLPRHRGRDAIEWAIRFGESVTGGTVYRMNGVMDGGPVVSQKWCWIYPGETASDVWRRRLFDIGVELLADAINRADEVLPLAEEQDQRLATFEPSIAVPRKERPDLIRIPAT